MVHGCIHTLPLLAGNRAQKENRGAGVKQFYCSIGEIPAQFFSYTSLSQKYETLDQLFLYRLFTKTNVFQLFLYIRLFLYQLTFLDKTRKDVKNFEVPLIIDICCIMSQKIDLFLWKSRWVRTRRND